MLGILDRFIDACGLCFILFFLFIAIHGLSTYVGEVLKKQRKIKCLCHHEYEPYCAWYSGGIEYEFKCRKCGKVISVKTVTKDKFDWVN